MDNLKDTIINECLNTLKRDDVKNDIKELMKPLVDMIIQQLYPYIFLSIIFVSISFLLILGTFILLLRYKYIFQKKN
tara:strand:+ start:22050 stop:22280 length:231 start_codon:yes stop_codon:yes gene_type:complete